MIYNGSETGRYRWDQLMKTEKTHYGTMFEINAQRVPYGGYELLPRPSLRLLRGRSGCKRTHGREARIPRSEGHPEATQTHEVKADERRGPQSSSRSLSIASGRARRLVFRSALRALATKAA
ncbi:hypothetical protein REA19_16680 [Prescottella equi]|nr:hypothetical protein REA19_16680 [Prescottella equi]